MLMLFIMQNIFKLRDMDLIKLESSFNTMKSYFDI